MSGASASPSHTIRVSTPSRSYHAVSGPGLLGEVGERARSVLGNFDRALVVCDEGVPASLITRAIGSLERVGASVQTIALRPSEQGKTLETTERVLAAALSARLDRTHPIITIGGGIVGDIGGFAAAIYRRGVAWVHCPTTLLAMVDASVGGKTGVNLLAPDGTLRKNMTGAFWQPSLVLADVDALASLADREMRCGLAECIKHGMLAAEFGDPELLEWTSANLAAVLARGPAVVSELIARNVGVKARVVEGDEREESQANEGGRALLNLGHTFGHALESIAGLSPTNNPADAPIRHGEAVALGLVAATALSASIGISKPDVVAKVRDTLTRAGLPVSNSHLPPSNELIGRMMDDKKVTGGRLRLIVPRGDGTCVSVVDPTAAAVYAAWDAIRA